MLNKLDVNMCSGSMGCGIYEVGTSQTRMFITDGGRVLPVEGHHITAEAKRRDEIRELKDMLC